jgi:hypothetical protein
LQQGDSVAETLVVPRIVKDAEENDIFLGVVDNVDPDNVAAMLAATSEVLNLNLAAVIVNGRPAHTNPDAPISEHCPEETARVSKANARRMAGILLRAGRDVPVFEGTVAPKTPTPHRDHIDERLLDIYNDEANETPITGDVDDAFNHLEKLDGTIHVIAGGPLTDVAELMRRPTLHRRLGNLTAQLGKFGWSKRQPMNTYFGAGKQFNFMCDPAAAKTVVEEWPGPLFIVPTDVTNSKTALVDGINRLESLGLIQELTDAYKIAYEHMEGFKRIGAIPLYDIHPVLLMNGLMNRVRPFSSSDIGSWVCSKLSDEVYSDYFVEYADINSFRIDEERLLYDQQGIVDNNTDRFIVKVSSGNSDHLTSFGTRGFDRILQQVLSS